MNNNLYRAMRSIINRLMNDDGTFDPDAQFALGILRERVDLGQEDWLTLLNKHVKVTFDFEGENKLRTVRILKTAWPIYIDGKPENRGLKELRDVVEGLTVAVPLDVARLIKEECEKVQANVRIS